MACEVEDYEVTIYPLWLFSVLYLLVYFLYYWFTDYRIGYICQCIFVMDIIFPVSSFLYLHLYILTLSKIKDVRKEDA